MATGGLREKLITEGIAELGERGLENFSVRRIAARCGVSCAAPYKHFPDKKSYISAIVDYINAIWEERQRAAASRKQTTREKIVEVCLEYIKFLVENPQLYAIILQSPVNDAKAEFGALRGRLSRPTRELINKYCAEAGIPGEVRRRKTFVVRSLVYGAVLMLGSGELDYTPESLKMVTDAINREFDLS